MLCRLNTNIMPNKEFKVGETFQCGLVKLKCVKSKFTCDGCYFLGSSLDCAIINKIITGSCIKPEREDKTDVIFVKVEE